MEFHSQKCSVLPITRSLSPQVNKYQLHGHTLKTETDSKYLGITINNKLSWNNHIIYIYIYISISLSVIVGYCPVDWSSLSEVTSSVL